MWLCLIKTSSFIKNPSRPSKSHCISPPISFLSPSSLGAEVRSVCTEAGMFAIRARRKMATEKDFLDAVNKVIKAYAKFSATPRYMTYN